MEAKSKAILNNETEFTRLTTKQQNIKINQLQTASYLVRSISVCHLQFASFFSSVPYIMLAQKRKKTTVRSRLLIQTRSTGIKVKHPMKYFHVVARTCPTNRTHEATKHSLTSHRDQILVPASTFLD